MTCARTASQAVGEGRRGVCGAVRRGPPARRRGVVGRALGDHLVAVPDGDAQQVSALGVGVHGGGDHEGRRAARVAGQLAVAAGERGVPAQGEQQVAFGDEFGEVGLVGPLAPEDPGAGVQDEGGGQQTAQRAADEVAADRGRAAHGTGADRAAARRSTSGTRSSTWWSRTAAPSSSRPRTVASGTSRSDTACSGKPSRCQVAQTRVAPPTGTAPWARHSRRADTVVGRDNSTAADLLSCEGGDALRRRDGRHPGHVIADMAHSAEARGGAYRSHPSIPCAPRAGHASCRAASGRVVRGAGGCPLDRVDHSCG